jgi:hypothetical protein
MEAETVLTEVAPPAEPINEFNLTARQMLFVESYKITGDATKSAISAGYALKSAHVEGHRLLKNAKVLAELKRWRIRKSSEITKNDFIDLALEDYRTLDKCEPNAPRFLDIAGKALGYTASNGGVAQVTNNTLIINQADAELLAPGAKWEKIRALLE